MAWSRWSARLLGVLLSASLAIPLGLLFTLNTPPGQRWLERAVAAGTRGAIRLKDLSGRIPMSFRIGRLEQADARGPWLTIENLALNISWSALAEGRLRIDRLDARRVDFHRWQEAPAEEGGGLPIPLELGRLAIEELNVAPPVTGMAARFGLEGEGRMGHGDDLQGRLSLNRRDAAGRYSLAGRHAGRDVEARLVIAEPPGGFLAHWVGLPDVGALAVQAQFRGPPQAVESRIELTAKPAQAVPESHPGQGNVLPAASGELRLEGQGRLDFVGEACDIRLRLTAGPMRPAPGLAWEALSLRADLHGPWSSPLGKVEGRLDRLRSDAWTIREIRVDATGDPGRFVWMAELQDARRPGAGSDLLQGRPLRLRGQMRPEGTERTVDFELRHPDATGQGDARLTAEGYSLHAGFKLPNLNLVSPPSGQILAGASELKVEAWAAKGDTRLAVEGQVGITSGPARLPELIGPAGSLRASALFNQDGITLDTFRVRGRNLSVEGQARLAKGRLIGTGTLSMPRLEGLYPDLRGRASVLARFEGPSEEYGATLDFEGEVGSAAFAPSPLKARLTLKGLPGKPVGELTAQGPLAGAPLDLRLRLDMAEGRPGALIDHAGWKTLKAHGQLRMESNRSLPDGRIDFEWPRLEDLRSLTGQVPSGGLSGRFDFGPNGHPDRIGFGVEARQLALNGSLSGAGVKLEGQVDGIPQTPWLQARLTARGLKLNDLEVAEWVLDASGPLPELAMRLKAVAPNLKGDALTLEAAARAEHANHVLRLETLAAAWRGETLRLLAPVPLVYRQGLKLGELRLGLRDSRLEASGAMSPGLDFKLNLKAQAADLAAVTLKGMKLAGQLEASARLTGTPQQPRGNLLVEVIKLRAASGAPAGLPPLNARLAADLPGGLAHLDGRLDLGPSVNLRLLGEAPTQAEGSMDLRATGRADLAVLDPWLTATGRRLHGQVDLDASLRGALPQPQVGGTLRLGKGEAQDYAQGLNLSRIEGLLEAGGDGRLRLRRLEAQAGPGSLRATGEVDLKAPGRPVNLILTGRNAQPLASDRLTANLDTDLVIRGPLAGPLTLSGPIRILRAEIRIPENMPAHIAVLKVRRSGELPPTPVLEKPDLLLELQIDASRQIFVRGRGIDAELDGSIRVKGSVEKPETLGRFSLRSGQLNLAGQTLNFSKGEIGFTGGRLNDPTLDFEASTNRGGIKAILNVGGSARKPIISLSSVPALPEDEILSQLLFGKSATALGPFEMARIAGALVSLTGATSGMVNPLEKIRRGLGLDRLAVGSDRTGNPTLEAGRYVMPGVYLGAKQGTTGGGTPQSVIQVDITDNLKVEGTIGAGNATGSTGNAQSAGVVYQFEY